MERSLAALLTAHIAARYGGNQSRFAEANDFRIGTVNTWVKGRVTFPQIEARRQIARALGISHVELLVAIGELDRDEVAGVGVPETAFPLGDMRQLVVDRLAGLSDREVGAILALTDYMAEHRQ